MQHRVAREAEKIGEYAIGAGHAQRQLAIEGICGIHVDTRAIAGEQQTSLLQILPRIVGLERSLIVRIPRLMNFDPRSSSTP